VVQAGTREIGMKDDNLFLTHCVCQTDLLICSTLTIYFQHSFIDSVETTNEMQPYNRTYYSTVNYMLNMFQVVRRSSSRALTVFAASGLHTHVVTGRRQV
jgi:hypothetical protein